MGENGFSKPEILLLIIVIILSIALSVFFSGIDKSLAEEKTSTLDKIRSSKLMKVCYTPWPPTIIKNPGTGELSGHLIDTIEEIARTVNIKLEYFEVTWANFPIALNSGQCDLYIAGTYRNIPRSFNVAFTEPIFYIGNGALVRKEFAESHPDINYVFDLDLKGIKIAVVQGTTEEVFIRQNFKNAELIVISNTSDLTLPFIEVLNGNADVAVTESYTIQQFAERNPEVIDILQENPFNITPCGWALRHGDVELLNFINTSLEYLRSTGTLDEFEKKYNAPWHKPKIVLER